MKIKIKRLHPDAVLPNYAHEGDVGLDMYSLENYDLQPGERRIFPVGFALEFKTGYAAIVKDKSSLPRNGGIHTMGGVFDAGYRGEYNAQLINLGSENYSIKKGDKIAQLIIFSIAIAELEEVDELSDSERGEGQFGSSGRNSNDSK
jgi:dUTP pyrophosphatase